MNAPRTATVSGNNNVGEAILAKLQQQKASVPVKSNRAHVSKYASKREGKPAVVVPAIALDLSVIEEPAILKAEAAIQKARVAANDARSLFKEEERENIKVGRDKVAIEASIKAMNDELPDLRAVEKTYKHSVQKGLDAIADAVRRHFGDAMTDAVKNAKIKAVKDASPAFADAMTKATSAQIERENKDAQIARAVSELNGVKDLFAKSTAAMLALKADAEKTQIVLEAKQAALIKAREKAAKQYAK